ncbi:hypothetical protein [Kitasatospora sp. NPDC101183]|uniref:hypothetical protein n=1 Tax=Kitasatospora sp. NPDC101183 TaxID=3364100 RepID=UPI0037F617E0
METGRIKGRGPDGREYVVRIFTQGTEDEDRWIECLTCGYRKRAEFGARAKAEEHLSGHCDGPLQHERNPTAVVGIMIVAGLFVLVGIMMIWMFNQRP